jgi:small subunit ribosomal protein S7
MPRRNRPPRRPVTPDIRYNNENVSRLINKVMQCGKKSIARRIVYDAFGIMEERMSRPAIEIFDQAIQNVSPAIEVKPRRVGGSTYQIPVEVDSRRRLTLAIRWILAAVRSRSGRSMAEKLAAELMDAAQGNGSAIKKKEDTHRMAEANRAFSHYRW